LELQFKKALSAAPISPVCGAPLRFALLLLVALFLLLALLLLLLLLVALLMLFVLETEGGVSPGLVLLVGSKADGQRPRESEEKEKNREKRKRKRRGEKRDRAKRKRKGKGRKEKKGKEREKEKKWVKDASSPAEQQLLRRLGLSWAPRLVLGALFAAAASVVS
jgi:hypothetical protein